MFNDLVVENLDADIVAGTAFMETSDVYPRPSKLQILVGDGTIYKYSDTCHEPRLCAVRLAHGLRALADDITIWSGDFLEVYIPQELAEFDADYAIEPRTDSAVCLTLEVANT